jgi:hypothetical protein
MVMNGTEHKVVLIDTLLTIRRPIFYYTALIPDFTFSFILVHAMERQKTAAIGGERYAAMD